MYKISGYDNEYEFVTYLNRKKVGNLNPLFRDLIDNLFGDLDESEIIMSWRNHYLEKTDIFIKINGVVRRISIKKGSRNSVHVERISDFIHFLIENGIDRDIVMSYLKYHYADGSTNGKGKNRVSVLEYKKYNAESIHKINMAFNDKSFVKKAIDRFVLKGNNSNYYIDAIIYGEVDDFLWMTRDEIIKAIMNKNNLSTAVHFGAITCQPKNRCLNYNSKYEKDRFCVQIKWYSIFDDMIEIMNDRVIKMKNISDN